MLGMGGHGIPDNIVVTTTTTGNLTLTSSAVPTNGFNLVGANTIGAYTNGVLRVSVSTSLVTLASGMGLTLTNGKTTITNTANANALQLISSATSQSPLVVAGASLTTGVGVYVGDYNALTTGGCIYAHSNSTNSSARALVDIYNGQAAATGAYNLQMTQNAANAFINFVATAAGNTTAPISTLTTPGATYGFAQIDVNGAKKWVQLLEDPS